MARVVYVGKSDAVQLLDGTECRQGVPVEVPDALAASLLEQDIWVPAQPATTPKPKPAPVADDKED